MIGIVLAGGQSRRFGQDKALYKLPHQSLTNAQTAIGNLLPICDRVILSASQTNFAQLTATCETIPRVSVIQDQAPFINCGPLGGLYAAACQFPGSTDYLLLAVDFPFVTANILATIASIENSYAATETHEQYAISHFTTSKQELVNYLQTGNFSLKGFVKDDRHCVAINFAATMALTNLNYEKESHDENKK